MSYISVNDLLAHAKKHKYAVGYFESWNIESTYAVVRAAEKLQSPVIIGYCGEYLNHGERAYKENLYVYASMLQQIAQASTVPVATLLNEADDLPMTYQAIKAGFDMVMFVDDEMPIDELTIVQKKLVEFAHPCGVAVEAELGSLPTADKKTGALKAGANTDPAEAARFVKETGVDALAVAVGNIHLLENKKATIDFDLLEKLYKAIPVPLVLHGGTGVAKPQFAQAIDLGIAKVNVGAGLKRVVIDAEKNYFSKNDVDSMNPNDVFGKGGPLDLATCGQKALMDTVIEFIQAFKSENMARK
jgi:ketose-bisphosphate aldolase